MKKQNISLKLFSRFLFSGLLISALTSCADDLLNNPNQQSPSLDSDTQLVISLAVPTDDAVVNDEQNADKSRAESAPAASEKQINDLRFIAFGSDGGEQVVNRSLTVPSDLPVAPRNGVATYQVKELTPGKYNVYIVANMGDALSAITTEGELKNVIRDYTSTLPSAGNLPMVYEPQGMIQIKGSGAANAPTLEATMTIAAVKVKYSIVFDNAVNSDVFGNAGLKINRAVIQNVAKQAYLVENTAKTDIEVRNITSTGSYFTDFTETPGNSSVNDRDIIETGNGAGTASLDSYSGKWVWTNTLYLPERYAATDASATTLVIEATMTADGNDSNEHSKYNIILSEYDGGADGERSMPRGTYYEVVGHVKSLGDATLDACITAKDWTLSSLDTDFVHTFLKVSKATASVTSLESEKISYDTDGSGGVSFECETKPQNKPIINAVISQSDKSITFSVNPAVDITQLNENQTKGTAECYIKAGNIKKRIDIDYDIVPFFTLTPSSIKIMYSNVAANNTKTYEYVTNLGGFIMTENGNKSTVKLGYNGSTTIKEFTATSGKSTIKVSCADPTAATGIITVSTSIDPETTTQFFYDVLPQAARTLTKYDSYRTPTTITVMPPLGPYRIFFRALNDWHIYDGGETQYSGEWLEGNNSLGSSYPTEDYGTGGEVQSNNWIDYWAHRLVNNKVQYNDWGATGNIASNNRYPFEDSHKIYIWTQIGETTSSQITGQVWRFTARYTEGENMHQDYNNRGWYYYNLDPNTEGFDGDNNNIKNPKRVPEPGTTLMIFNNFTNNKLGYNVHRATHHLDPGIPLFDFEDREGWVVYDPTMDPYYRIYDDKPYVEDVTYTIWSNAKPTGWYRKYGVAENNVGTSGSVKQFTVWSNNVSDVTTQNGFYCYKLRMKAVRGDYEKAIRVKFTGVTESGTTTTVPGVGHYVYYYYKSSSGKGWSNPKAYFYSNSSSPAWGPSSFKSPISSSNSDGGVYYKFEVPAGYYDGRVIFVNSDGSSQFPWSGQEGLAIANRNKVFYSDSGELNATNHSNYWKEYGEQPSDPSTVTTGEEGFVLFNGRAYPNNEGYFNTATKTWKPGKPF